MELSSGQPDQQKIGGGTKKRTIFKTIRDLLENQFSMNHTFKDDYLEQSMIAQVFVDKQTNKNEVNSTDIVEVWQTEYMVQFLVLSVVN